MVCISSGCVLHWYKGKTYYVCCSGCKAAFEDEPERWIARLEAQKAEKMKANN